MKLLEILAHSTDTQFTLIFLKAAVRGHVSEMSTLMDASGIRAALNHPEPKVVFRMIELLPELTRKQIVTVGEIVATQPFAGIPDGDIARSLAQAPIHVKFPVAEFDEAVGKHTGKLAEALVFPWETSRSVAFPRSMSLPPKLAGSERTAFVVFDRTTQGDSGQLAIAVALESGRESKSVLFSGTVGRDGSVGNVDYWDEKEVACRHSRCVLLGATHVQTVKQAMELTFADPLDVPVFLHIYESSPDNNYDKLLQAADLPYPESGLFQLLGLSPKELCRTDQRMISPAPEDWQNTINKCRSWLHDCMAQLPHRRIRFHLGFRIPSDLALALGCITRGKKTGGIIPYQYEEGSYYPVAGDGLETIPTPEMKVVTEDFGADGSSVPVIGIRIGTAPIERDLVRLCRKEQCRMIYMEPESPDFTMPPGDWQGIANDFADIIQDHMEERCRLVLNIPLGLAFFLGRTLSHFRNIEVLHLENGSYHPVFNLCDLKELAL